MARKERFPGRHEDVLVWRGFAGWTEGECDRHQTRMFREWLLVG